MGIAAIATDTGSVAPIPQSRPAARTHKYSLAELLAGITPENLHAEVRTGGSAGKEAW